MLRSPPEAASFCIAGGDAAEAPAWFFGTLQQSPAPAAAAPALRSPVGQTFLPLRKPAPEELFLPFQGTGTEFRSSPLPVPRHSTLHLLATQVPLEQATNWAAQAEQAVPPHEQQPPQPTALPPANVRLLLDSVEKPAADAGTSFASILNPMLGIRKATACSVS